MHIPIFNISTNKCA